MAQYYQEFTVRWNDAFPLGMLDYNNAFPAGEEAVKAIRESFSPCPALSRGPHEARLGRMVEREKDLPTIARWKSFGCTLEDIHTWRTEPAPTLPAED